jgi:uncharacterized protein
MAESLKSRLRADLNDARRARDRLGITVLGMALSELKNREIELGREVDDGEVTAVLVKEIKVRRESSEQMRAGGRADLAEAKDREAEFLAKYLPPSLTEEEVRALVREAIAGGAGSIGEVMGRIMPKLKGAFDGREANRIVREELGA